MTQGLWGTFTHNLVVLDHGQMLDGLWTCPAGSDCRSAFDLHDNDDFTVTGAVSFALGSPAGTQSLAAFQAAQAEELGSISVDPSFAPDFSLPAGSPALAIGFVPFPLGVAGRSAPVLMPAAVPAGYPLQDPADPGTFF